MAKAPEQFGDADPNVVLQKAIEIGLDSVLVLSRRADGTLVVYTGKMSFMEANWLMDSVKVAMQVPAMKWE